MQASRNRVVRALAVLASAAPAAAQLEAARQFPPLRVPIHTATADQGRAYGIWAAAESYKASFHDGMTFVPYLGDGYPHNQSWSWRTIGATVGGVALIAPGATAEPVQGQYRYEYRFGAVTEAYDVRTDGLEQTFVVAQLPARGDLVIRGAVTSSLLAPHADAAQQSLTFVDGEGRAIVGYGQAWAFDARGARTAVTTAHHDGIVTLTVPRGWLAHAELPIVVDPLLTRQQVLTGPGATITNVDIGHDHIATVDDTMVVTTRAASQVDHDVYAHLCNADFSGATVVYSDVTAGWDSDGGCCAFVGGAARWVVAWRRYYRLDNLRSSRLCCHVHDSGDTAYRPSTISYAGLAHINDWRPDIGGVLGTLGSKALVVFQRENNFATGGHFSDTASSDIYGMTFDAVSSTFGAVIPIAVGPNDGERPSVNQAATGAATEYSWLCAFQHWIGDASSGTWDVFARRIDSDGGFALTTWRPTLAGQDTHHELGPSIAGDEGRYLMAFAMVPRAQVPAKNSEITGTQLWVQRADWPHGSPTSTGGHEPVLIADETAIVLEAPCVAHDHTDDSHFAIGYRTTDVAVPAVFGARVGFRGQLTEGPTELWSQAGQSSTPPACTFAGDQLRFDFAYGVADGVTETAYGHSLLYVPAPPVSVDGFGCDSAVLSWSGQRQIGAEFDLLQCALAAPTALHIVLASLAPLDVPGPLPETVAGCRLLIDILPPAFITVLPAAVGSEAAWQIPLYEEFTPTTLYFQDWLLDDGLLTSTPRLEVQIVK